MATNSATHYRITSVRSGRYDESLITNAEFRIQGRGDGRISKQDAEELWRLALDGGRVTEIEENTLAYILETFNVTEAAREYLIAEMEREKADQEEKGYYKIIDGKRYDRKALEEAERLAAGQGDGRISLDDAEALLPFFLDAGNLTIIEERTLQYILDNIKWTEPALNYFMPKIDRISKTLDAENGIDAVQREFGVEGLAIAYYRSELVQQTLDFPGPINFVGALRKAVDSLINDTSEGSFASNITGLTDEGPAAFLDGCRLVLLPGNMASEPTFDSFPSPLRGETTMENWIFGLELFDKSDDIYWVIVPRRGGAVYNYIGGPNVEDEWPRGSGEKFFTIQILSCNEPYPGVPVDVQDPDGKFYVEKSDANGQVKVQGPAGLYYIYASDGWSFQSTRYDWDGKGNTQVKNAVLDC